MHGTTHLPMTHAGQKGCKGEFGETGDVGIKGEKGDPGGEKGQKGDPGLNGKYNCVLVLSSVTYIHIRVSRSA